MICNSIVVLCLLGIVAGIPFRNQEEDYRYHGPPATLNPDGTVAFTPEYEHIRDEHSAAFEREYQRIKNSIDGADPYNVKFPSKPHGGEDHGHLPEIHEHDAYDTPLEHEGYYHPDLFEKPYISLYDEVQYRPPNHDHDHLNHEQYSTLQSTQDTSYRPAYVPATLNGDGTVAHTPEYNAIASSFNAAYHQALSRHRRSAERYQGPPAPLNHDLTVDYTPEVKHLGAAHFIALANQYKKLQATAALAAAHSDRTSPPSKDYNPSADGQYVVRKKRSFAGQYSHQLSNTRQYDDGQYKPHLYKHDDGQYKPHLYHVVDYNTVPYRPAPLNADGTVAHLPEYHAIAASHLAAHHNALSSVTH